MMNFNSFMVTNIVRNWIDCTNENYAIDFSYKIGEENREGMICFDIENENICVFTNFVNTPEEIEVINNPNNFSFNVEDILTPEIKIFFDFLKNNGVPVTTPKEVKKWYSFLYQNKECFRDYNKSSL